MNERNQSMVDPQTVAHLKLDEPAVAELLLLIALYDPGCTEHVSELLRHIDASRYFRHPASRLLYAVRFHLLPAGYIGKEGDHLTMTESGKTRLRDLCELANASPSRVLSLTGDGHMRVRELRGALRIYPFTNGQPATSRPHSRDVADHSLYVILLHEDALKARYESINPELDRTLPCLYVGMTRHSPLQRFDAHRFGRQYLSSKYVSAYGLCLVPLLYSHLNVRRRDRIQVMDAERRLAEELRRHRFPVFAGHHDRPATIRPGT